MSSQRAIHLPDYDGGRPVTGSWIVDAQPAGRAYARKTWLSATRPFFARRLITGERPSGLDATASGSGDLPLRPN